MRYGKNLLLFRLNIHITKDRFLEKEADPNILNILNIFCVFNFVWILSPETSATTKANIIFPICSEKKEKHDSSEKLFL
jgi:hypothetical protein